MGHTMEIEKEVEIGHRYVDIDVDFDERDVDNFLKDWPNSDDEKRELIMKYMAYYEDGDENGYFNCKNLEESEKSKILIDAFNKYSLEELQQIFK